MPHAVRIPVEEIDAAITANETPGRVLQPWLAQ